MAEATIGTAYVLIEPTAKGISGKIEQEMGGEGEKAGSSFSKGFGKVLKGGGAIATALVSVGTAATSALVSGTKELAEYGDNIDKMSQKMGMSAEGYQEWEAVMQHSGTSMETMKASMKTLATAAETNNEAFAQLGITEQDLASMNQEELFNATISSLQNVEDETQRTYLAGKLLGRGATELGALLNMSSDETQAMKDRVHELGGVLGDDAVKDAAAFQDQMQDMTTSFQGITRGLLSEFLPEVTGIMSGLTEVFSGNMDEGVAQISTGIESLLSLLLSKLPEIISFAGKLVEQLILGLLQELPSVAQTGLTILLELVRGIIEALPTLIPQLAQVVVDIAKMLTEPDTLVSLIMAGVDLMVALIEGLADAIPLLIEAAPMIIENLVKALILLIPKLWDAAKRLVEALGRGIVNTFYALGNAISELWSMVKEAFHSRIESAKTWGKDLIDNFIGGIKEKWEAFKETLSGLANTVKDFLGFSVPEKGPLHEWATNNPGYDMVELFTEGMKDATPDLEAELSQNVAMPMLDMMNASMNASVNSGVNEQAPTPIIVRLEGDAQKFFSYIQSQNDIYKRMNGQSAFA